MTPLVRTATNRRRRSSLQVVMEAMAIGGALFLLAPLAMVLAQSIGRSTIATFPPDALSLAAYDRISSRWVDALLNSVVVAVGATVAASVFGTCGALALARGRFRSRALIEGALRSPLQAPGLVVGVAFLTAYSWTYQNLGLPLVGSLAGLVIAHTAVSLPFVLTVVLARLASLDSQLEEAAAGLGAGPLQTFLRVTLPSIAPAVFSGGLFAFLLSLDNVPLSLFLVGGSTALLPVDLFQAIQFDATRAVYAVATLVCIGTTIVVVLAYRRLVRYVSPARA